MKFMDTLQDSGEKPSAYLQRLQVALSLAVKRGGVKPTDVNRYLLSQFCRGCWDNNLIAELQLKQLKANPPPFQQLLLLLRTEEDREASKTQRMKQHLGTSRQRVAAQAQFAVEEESGVSAALSSLTKQVADIQRQLAALTASQSTQQAQSRQRPVSKPQQNLKSARNPSSSPKPGFCFRCGEDGHIRPQCENRPNEALVNRKRKQFNERKQQSCAGPTLSAKKTTVHRADLQTSPGVNRKAAPGLVGSSDESLQDHELIHHFITQHTADSDVIPEDIVNAICQSHLVRAITPDDPGLALVESLAITADTIPDSYSSDDLHQLPVIPALDIKEKQHADSCIRELLHQLKTGEKTPPTARAELPELPLLLREWSRLELVDGVLYRRRRDDEGLSYQLVLPEELRPLVLKNLHDDMGHMGIERTLDLVRSRFYWPRMAMDVEKKVKSCGRCVRRKALPERAAPLVSIQTTRPLELLCMDFLSLEPDSSNTRDILVLTDHFTKFAVAFPTPNQKAKTVAKCLWENFIIFYGIPERIHTDQGQDFESRLIKELCEVAGIRKSRTTPYHPRGNPVERFNRTLLAMLGTLEPKQKTRWKEHVKPLVHAYNCTRNEVTGYTPYELMFGRTPRLPVDLAFNLPVRETQHKNHMQYIKALKSRMEESFKIASKNAAKSADRNKARFDRRVRPSALEPGDKVLVRNVRLRGKHKLSDKWEEQVYVVVHRAGELPVYKIKPENSDGPTRTLHRDLLLPCGFLSDSEENSPSPENSPVRRPRTRQQKSISDSSIDSSAEDGEQESSVSVNVCPPTFRFTVERDHHAPYPNAGDDNQRPSSPDLPVQPEEQSEQNLSLSSNPPSVVCSEEQSESEMEEEIPEHVTENDLPEPTENDVPVTENDNLPTNLPVPEEVLVNDNPPDESVPVNPQTNDSDVTIRRSNRQRLPPKRLQYSTLGNPLISVVQTVLHSLSDALTLTLRTPCVAFNQSRARSARYKPPVLSLPSFRRLGVKPQDCYDRGPYQPLQALCSSCVTILKWNWPGVPYRLHNYSDGELEPAGSRTRTSTSFSTHQQDNPTCLRSGRRLS
ncbi:hypothetical protein WMY93_016524 [Mugilogobius chulae]|uniref:Gypsy retrotransposon integrase-like protein 1 n=1 Tax=Mugilogobius chulae TaxID=88201 RepID=A0AAW0NWL1_9GOBI